MLQLTDNAVKKVKQLLQAENKADHALRVAVKGGGCAGFEYDLTFDDKAGENDHILEFGDLKVYVDAISARYLQGTEIDYVMGMAGAGFKFNNPNASGSCGCGSSFSV